jgi:hypothetical protein
LLEVATFQAESIDGVDHQCCVFHQVRMILTECVANEGAELLVVVVVAASKPEWTCPQQDLPTKTTESGTS